MHYFPTNIKLDIPVSYIHDFISRNPNAWTRHKSTVSGRMTPISYIPLWQNNNLINKNWNPGIKTKIPRTKFKLAAPNAIFLPEPKKPIRKAAIIGINTIKLIIDEGE